ncbi:hypothetical protein SXBG_00160 [Synechococcus phage S-CAM1]|jgi:hypothetical protein|uniref:Uncharacterized protein n=1 Tax=Synechococcus phage S-CAM1 TaxID=754037 RepID=M4QS38_9CAUD|nr:hypothetical protein SXBG_00160 [Synechococcus phage S-CAM1]AGH26895.1 hypothetical protein SXBG_00160 [Synechococcus phage S-CAM1]AOV57430.1 hypothetical protein N330309_175 [Synechococcus phage S-CAM1]AOV57680.1 hypothetical protein N170310_175 [Synechococcus phage S-CAM1]AOV57930.1 hypothetical protein C030809_175 [Synechococcus phage S-CAM1]AOV58180.1 hypothetical protein S170810_175 [Synechococcus phage S-CAM1]
MANAIVVLQSTGDKIICDLQEVREENKEDGKPVCLVMIRPYTLGIEKSEEPGPNGQDVQVRFNKWLPYSGDTQFKIPFAAVLAVGSVDPGLEQAYVQTVAQAVAMEEAQVEAAAAVAAETGFVPSEEVTDAETASV